MELALRIVELLGIVAFAVSGVIAANCLFQLKDPLRIEEPDLVVHLLSHFLSFNDLRKNSTCGTFWL